MSFPLEIAAIVSMPFAENTFIARLPGRSDCLVFDPGMEPEKITEYLAEQRLTPKAFLCTHGHSDHIAGNEAMKRCWPDCPLIIGEGDAPKLTDPKLNLSADYGFPMVSPPADQTVVHGETIEFAGIPLEVRHAPGHSAGHVVFVHHQGEPKIVFGGDVLFEQGIGRYDFPDGDLHDLLASIREQLFTLPDSAVVLTGHGNPTTIGQEKEHNPYVGRRAGYKG